MISCLSGNIVFRGSDFILLEVHDIGYKIFLSAKTLSKLSKTSASHKFYTHLRLREDSADLYGFISYEELILFETLNNISGIGPKTALILSSVGSLGALQESIEKEPEALLKDIKGVGAKKMQKIILEVSGKIKKLNTVKENGKNDEALSALTSLGFSRKRADDALASVPPDISNTDKRIKEALKILSR